MFTLPPGEALELEKADADHVEEHLGPIGVVVVGRGEDVPADETVADAVLRAKERRMYFCLKMLSDYRQAQQERRANNLGAVPPRMQLRRLLQEYTALRKELALEDLFTTDVPELGGARLKPEDNPLTQEMRVFGLDGADVLPDTPAERAAAEMEMPL